jgi:hypothetical protein
MNKLLVPEWPTFTDVYSFTVSYNCFKFVSNFRHFVFAVLPATFSFSTDVVIFLMQERVSRQVPTFAETGLLLSLKRFRDLSTFGAGFSTCSDPCWSWPPTFSKHLL